MLEFLGLTSWICASTTLATTRSCRRRSDARWEFPSLKLELELILPKPGHPLRAAGEEVLESYEHRSEWQRWNSRRRGLILLGQVSKTAPGLEINEASPNRVDKFLPGSSQAQQQSQLYVVELLAEEHRICLYIYSI